VDDLTYRMRAVTDTAPPTRIDIDALISGERRRGHVLRLAGVTGGTAVAVAATLWTVSALPGPGGIAAGGLGVAASPSFTLCAPLNPSPSGRPGATKSDDAVQGSRAEPVPLAVARLSIAFDDALGTVLPGIEVSPTLRGCDRPQFQYSPRNREYSVDVRLSDNAGSGGLYLTVSASDPNDPRQCQQGATCERRDLPGGGVALLYTLPNVVGIVGSTQYQVTVDRPDGMRVFVMSNNIDYHGNSDPKKAKVTRSGPIGTLDQLVQLGQTPGLTFNPR
jgi:hypothetical protein